MSSLVIFFVAIIAVIIPINVVNGEAAAVLDLGKILELVQQQQDPGIIQRKPRNRDDSSESDSSSDSDISFSTLGDSSGGDALRYARLRREKIIDLLEKVAHANNNGVQNEDRRIEKKARPIKVLNLSEKRGNSQRNNNIQSQILQQLLSRSINNEKRQVKLRADRPKRKLKPGRLVTELSKRDLEEYNEKSGISGLEDYSKVYIVLNPDAIQTSKNKNSLSELVSKVLALSSAPVRQNNESKKKPRRYKGFLLKGEHLTRRSRPSKENSEEAEYRPKRYRGGGSSAGHTAVPYLHHRGDIYEKDDH